MQPHHRRKSLMPVIKFATEKIKAEWLSESVSESLRIVARAVILKFDGAMITCLIRSPAKNTLVGGVSSSLHICQNSPDKKCRAVDFVLLIPQSPTEVCEYVKSHFIYVDILYHRNHFHLEIDTKSPVLHPEIV